MHFAMLWDKFDPILLLLVRFVPSRTRANNSKTENAQKSRYVIYLVDKLSSQKVIIRLKGVLSLLISIFLLG